MCAASLRELSSGWCVDGSFALRADPLEWVSGCRVVGVVLAGSALAGRRLSALCGAAVPCGRWSAPGGGSAWWWLTPGRGGGFATAVEGLWSCSGLEVVVVIVGFSEDGGEVLVLQEHDKGCRCLCRVRMRQVSGGEDPPLGVRVGLVDQDVVAGGARDGRGGVVINPFGGSGCGGVEPPFCCGWYWSSLGNGGGGRIRGPAAGPFLWVGSEPVEGLCPKCALHGGEFAADVVGVLAVVVGCMQLRRASHSRPRRPGLGLLPPWARLCAEEVFVRKWCWLLLWL